MHLNIVKPFQTEFGPSTKFGLPSIRYYKQVTLIHSEIQNWPEKPLSYLQDFGLHKMQMLFGLQ